MEWIIKSMYQKHFLIPGGFKLSAYMTYIYVGAAVSGFVLLIFIVVLATRLK